MTMADASLFDAFAYDVPTAPKSQPAPRRSRKPASRNAEPDDTSEPLAAWYLGDPDPGASREFVVDGMLGRRELAFWVGAPFAGKSALAARLAVDVASGSPFLGSPTAAVPVVYVAAERAAETRRRLTAAAAELPPSMPVVVVGGRGDLTDPVWRASLLARLDEVAARCGAPVGLIVLDTLSRLTAGRDENGQGAASAAIDAIQEIADAGPSVVVLHHVAKDGKDPRGSSAFAGGADAIFRVTKATAKSPAALHLAETNLGAEGGRWPFVLDTAGDAVVARGIEADDAPPPRAGRADEFAAVFRECFAAVARDGAADRKALGVELRKRQPDANAATSRSRLKRLRDAGVYHQVGEHIFLGPDPKKSEAAS